MNYEELNDNELVYLCSENNEDATIQLINKYKSMILIILKDFKKKYKIVGVEITDLYQEGLIGLLNAINNFKEQKDIKFSTFAFLCIKRKILTAVKNANRKKHSILNESYSLDYKQDDDIRSFDNTLS